MTSKKKKNVKKKNLSLIYNHTKKVGEKKEKKKKDQINHDRVR